MKPEDSHRLNRAIAYRDEKKVDEACQLLSELRANYPHDALVQYHSGRLFDSMGDERAAIPFYETAIKLGLSGEELKEALVGLGSSHRCVGNYEEAAREFLRGVSQFPESPIFSVFLAMTLYNLGRHREAAERLLKVIAHHSADPSIERYKKAIVFYSERLDEIWQSES